ncbi:hypothetical protein Tco_0689066, partial [Tanacetum coccineum]
SECAAMETIVVAIPLPKSKGHYLETLEVIDWKNLSLVWANFWDAYP